MPDIIITVPREYRDIIEDDLSADVQSWESTLRSLLRAAAVSGRDNVLQRTVRSAIDPSITVDTTEDELDKCVLEEYVHVRSDNDTTISVGPVVHRYLRCACKIMWLSAPKSLGLPDTFEGLLNLHMTNELRRIIRGRIEAQMLADTPEPAPLEEEKNL